MIPVLYEAKETKFRTFGLGEIADAYEVKNLDRDREITKKIIDRHEERLGRVEDEVIINKERIITLFKKGEEK
ncbi:TPA: hypothetical protein ACIEP9_001796 [Streptococcus pyogenes]|uniref:hypothetical protein n=1 Tax=Streptococcus pyogenes TaxID=1314 RepID=UPI002B3C8B2A|nr:hypothetical protein [Streptococcus pyogenes]HEQ8957025.1 hypothetical protein [Streptococcus pyogenes]HEQ9061985.1 hypothetical protein [Streptococcus pyogenes]HER0009057.1 hypothetical protein [Streptococcus pyogenes]HER0845724.1 hypothetical protein [Streptococcus pyogenes]